MPPPKKKMDYEGPDPFLLRKKMEKLFETTIDTAQYLFDYGTPEVWVKLIQTFVRSNPNAAIEDEADRLLKIQEKMRTMLDQAKEMPRVPRPALGRANDPDQGSEDRQASA